ncbi:MAG TPA: hypothetical protein VN083_09845 [Vicinamibacteria bacterium]|jgi:hypothetical protein|nr:hypothetical protein [Vicinamibacteria bacterium]
MADRDSIAGRRFVGPEADPEWLSLDDDELLFRIEALGADHKADDRLIGVVRSRRHFFIRQEAAKKIRDQNLLRDHSQDRHIGQIFVRALTRAEDVSYLERLAAESRHIEVRNAADAQLKLIASTKDRG